MDGHLYNPDITVGLDEVQCRILAHVPRDRGGSIRCAYKGLALGRRHQFLGNGQEKKYVCSLHFAIPVCFFSKLLSQIFWILVIQ